MWLIEEPLECESSEHEQNSNSKRRILEGQKVYISLIDGEIDKACCSKCDIRGCYENNLAEVQKVLEGKLVAFENKNEDKNRLEVEKEWNLRKDKKDEQKEL